MTASVRRNNGLPYRLRVVLEFSIESLSFIHHSCSTSTSLRAIGQLKRHTILLWEVDQNMHAMTREPDQLTSTIFHLILRNRGPLRVYWFGFTGQPIGLRNTDIHSTRSCQRAESSTHSQDSGKHSHMGMVHLNVLEQNSPAIKSQAPPILNILDSCETHKVPKKILLGDNLQALL